MSTELPPLLALLDTLPQEKPDRDAILSAFLEYVSELGIEPYPAQEEAFLELLEWKHVILNTPTGSGKSLVALALHFQAMAEGRNSWYTAPTKALVNEKFFALCDAFGAENVGLLTGDASVNREAPIICCTAEILSNMALRDDDAPVDYVVMDEFHYYGDRDRGTAWQIPLITLKDTVFLLMSATLGDTEEIQKSLKAYTDRDVTVVIGSERPVPLTFEYRETALHETIQTLIENDQAPVYLVNFTQRDCPEQAQNLMSINVSSKEEKRTIAKELESVDFGTPYGKEFQRFVRHGIGVHHAGLLPKYRRTVERLAQSGLIKVISGTDTLGVGVNIPIRTVVVSRLYKYDGEKIRILSARQFHQISGRAGRRGFDDEGLVVVQAPEWHIENKKNELKIAKNPNLKKKLQRRKAPPRSLEYDVNTYNKLLHSPPEALTPRFEVTHGMLINLLIDAADRLGGGYRRFVEVNRRSHGTVREKRQRLLRASRLFRSLRGAGIIELVPNTGESAAGKLVRVQEGLQREFSLNQALSLYLIETLERVDPESDNYALDALTLVEAILEDPKVILMRQLDRVKDELIARLKAEGVEYEARMNELDKAEHPKPNRDFIYETFNDFTKAHPWVEDENIRPKSIAREIYEKCWDFGDYIREYGLARSEGVVLRYISQVYKTALQTVPEPYWTEEFEDILSYFFNLLRDTDSSLIEEWELLSAGPLAVLAPEEETVEAPAQERSILDDPRAFRARLRSELHGLLRALAKKEFDLAVHLVHQTDEHSWTEETLKETLAPYFEEHKKLDITPYARAAHNTIMAELEPKLWSLQQKIIDPDGDEDWMLDCLVDFRTPRDENAPLIELRRVGL